MNETIKDAHKLAEQIKTKHQPNVIQVSELLLTGSKLCPFIGHPMHEFLNDCVVAYCEANEIDVDDVNACIADIEQAERTIMELTALELGESRLQGQGVGDEFFARFKKGG
jgi:hypothetical protein